LKPELEEVLQHFGTKGMHWGVRKAKDELNNKERVIKNGTTIQNISSRELTKPDRHMYAAYTSYDKTKYGDMMGNAMYDGKGYKNEFVVKKDIRVPSDKQLVETFVAMAKSNPKQVSRDMAAAYNNNRILFEKSAKHFEKKISKIKDADSKKGEALTKQFISEMVNDKAKKSRADFFGALMKKGFDAMSDTNDRDGISNTQDPLIIFNTTRTLGEAKSVKLTKDDLNRYAKATTFNKDFNKQKKNLKEVQHNQEVKSMKPELQDILQHHGVKGMHWGKRKAGGSGSEVAKAKTPSKIKSHIDSIKREHDWKKTLKNTDKMSTKEIGQRTSRAQLENDMKRLSKIKKVGSKKDRQDYLKRADMSDQELFRKVQRLRAKSSLKRVASDATKSQKEIAKKLMHIAAPLALQYALTKSVGKKDVINAATNAAVNLGGAKARLVKNLVDQARKVKHSEVLDDEETIQHHGVKGMHWGVRGKVQKAVKAHRAKQNQRVLDYHEKNKGKKAYKKLYSHNSKRYKSHLAAARKTREQVAAIHRQRAVIATKLAVGLVAANRHGIAKGVNSAKNAVKNPDNIRKAKNVAQALKRSPIRYVDGSKMKNVIN
jgi:hypothetical protein